MPCAYTIAVPRSLVLSRGWGILTGPELIRHARALAADPRFRPHFSQLTDMREITELQVTAPVIRDLAGLNPFGAGARRAVVVSTDAAFGMARMYEILIDHSPDVFEVFRDLDQALEWLGVAAAKMDLLQALSEAPPLPAMD